MSARHRIGVLAFLLALVLVAGCSNGDDTTTGGAASGSTTTTTSSTGSTSAASSTEVTKKVVAAANAFLATLGSTEKDTVLFDWTDTAQKQRWSNFPTGMFQRAGLMWGNLSQEQQNAWLAIMQASLSSEGSAPAWS
jgi:Protein of unknown function (DUF3500)